MSAPRILVIRGGAIGDFVLTLPAIRMLRQTFPHCHLEILGYRHIAELALRGGPGPETTYADAVRSIEYGPLAAFFGRNGDLAPDLCEYFAGFQQVVSWLFDPDGIFEANLARAGVRHYLGVYEKIAGQQHASVQLARGLERMALFIDERAARLVPDASSRSAAAEWIERQAPGVDHRPLVALHPGSGSERKNWPVGNWRHLADRLASEGARLLVIGGEADTAVLQTVEQAIAIHRPIVSRNLPLPTLAALLARCVRYFGHDTGISHIAAAVGTPSTLIFGPTDPAVWAPIGGHVKVVRAKDGDLTQLPLDDVLRQAVRR